MQDDLDLLDPAVTVKILGVNQMGQERDNALACQGKDIPWLQETGDALVWGPWQVSWRDVVILDQDNQKAAVFNLTTYDLSVPANYDSLMTLLLEVGQD